MKIKLLVALFLFLLYGTGVMHVQAQAVSFSIKSWDGTERNIDLKDISKITFDDTNLLLNYPASAVESVATSNIRKIVFGTLTAVQDVRTEANVPVVYPNPGIDFISLKNLAEGPATVGVYSICGTQLISLTNYLNGETINISGLAKGIYLIKVNNTALKFTKQ